MSNPLLHWSVYKGIEERIHDNTCGELCSLRFTWMRPRSHQVGSVALDWMLELATKLANSPLVKLHRNGSFSLAQFKNDIVAEFEINEELPDCIDFTCFIKANFTDGHVTNQPLAGYFNEEGSIFADANGMKRLVIENIEMSEIEDELVKWRMIANEQ